MRDVQAARGTALTARRRAVRALALGIALVGLAVDQLIKIASVAYLEPGQPVPLVGELLQLNLIFNPGAAFGMGANATIVFAVFAIVAIVVSLTVALPRISQVWHAVALGLLIAGAAGNLVDRMIQPPSFLHGHVVDMFQLQYFGFIFNFADACITAAAALIIVGGFVADRRAANQ